MFLHSYTQRFAHRATRRWAFPGFAILIAGILFLSQAASLGELPVSVHLWDLPSDASIESRAAFVDLSLRRGHGYSSLDQEATLFNDKLNLPAFLKALDSDATTGDLVAHVLRRSFGLEGLSPQEVSRALTSHLHDGIAAHGSASIPILSYATGIAATKEADIVDFRVATGMRAMATVPAGPLLGLFSETEGLVRGNSLDLSHMRIETSWTTDFGLTYTRMPGRDLTIGGYGVHAWSASATYTMGHQLLAFQMDQGKMTFRDDNFLQLEGHGTIKSVGMLSLGEPETKVGSSRSARNAARETVGIHNPLGDGFSVYGHGLSIGAAIELTRDDHGFVFSFSDVGAILWARDVVAADLTLGGDSVTLLTLQNEENDFSLGMDTTSRDARVVRPTPAHFSIAYRQIHPAIPFRGRSAPILSTHVVSGFEYVQGFTRMPLWSTTPEFRAVVANTCLRGNGILSLGWRFGGVRGRVSEIGFASKGRRFTLSVLYEAIGSMLFAPRNGLGLRVGIKVPWQFGPWTTRHGVRP